MSTLFRSKPEVIHDLLQKAIIRGEYGGGERLVIDELSSKLGVSQIPIREALRQLEADGFVTFEPYVGATVTEISDKFIFEIFALLEALEGISGRRACQLLTEEEIGTLHELVQRMDECTRDPEQWSNLNKTFHLQIADFAHTTLVQGMLRNVMDHWDRLRQRYFRDVFGLRIEQAQEEHRLIMAAFQEREADEVERLIRLHNNNALASYITHLQGVDQTAGGSGDDE